MVISTNSLPCGYVIRVKQISHRTVHDYIVRMNKNRMDKYTNANYYLSPLKRYLLRMYARSDHACMHVTLN